MSVTINSDRTISINGRKTFPLGIYGACVDYADGTPSKPETCAQSLQRLSEFTYCPTPPSETSWDSPSDPWLSAFTNVMFCVKTVSYYAFYKIINNPYLFGYAQIDEPDGVTAGKTPVDLNNAYNNSKNADSTHPVILNHWHNASIWYPYCDIFSWDNYTIQDNPYEQAYTRATCIFLWEAMSYSNIVSQIGNGNLDAATKPVITVLQANVLPYTSSPHNYAVPTRSEARCLIYTAITLGVKGLSWWTYSIPWLSPDYGLMTNNTKLQEYIQFVRELKSLNEILVSPTVDKSYEYLKGTRVIFSPNLTMSIDGRNRQMLNYMLKQYGGSTYLIVVNKSSTSLSNINITVSGISGSRTAITRGLETTGSSRAGRTINVTNGSFTDSFDGYAAHIYEISSCYTAPSISMTIQ